MKEKIDESLDCSAWAKAKKIIIFAKNTFAERQTRQLTT
jgi:hypothetical protein